MKRFNIQRIVFIIILMLVFMISCTAYSEEAIPNATKNFYVNDFADIFNADQEQEMMDRAVALAYKPEGVQVVVSTVKTLGGLSVEDYANNMYNKYKIGKDDKGILILIAIEERKVRVEVGYSLESYMTDSKAGKFIQDYAISYLKNNQFDLGIMALQKALVEDLDGHFEKARVTATPKVRPTDVPVTKSASVESEPMTRSNVTEERMSNSQGNDYGVVAALSLAAAIIFIIGFIVQTVRLRKSEKNRDYESREYDKKLNSRDSTISSLKYDLSKLGQDLSSKTNQCSMVEQKYNQLKDRYRRAAKLHDGLDKEIDDMIQKEIDEKNREIAKKFDSRFAVLATDGPLKKYMDAGPKGWSTFDSGYRQCFETYEELTEEQRVYVKTDMKSVHSNHKAGMHQKSKEDADVLNQKLKSVTKECSGSERNLSTFENLQSEYNAMNELTQSFVSAALIASLGKLVASARSERKARIAREEAEEEERRRRRRQQEEEEEERRRQSSYSYDSSSFGGFDGFGGSSGGGGASSSF